jgi:hypothetical protein
MTLKSFFITTFFGTAILTASLGSADCCEENFCYSNSCAGNTCSESKVCGKVELSPTYIHIDLLDEGKTVDRMDLPAIRGDACWCIWKGLVLKPTIMWGKNDKQLFTTGAAIGHITPIISDCFYLTPLVGMNYTYLKTDTSLPPLGLTNLDQKFRSYAPYVGMEATWNFAPMWRVHGTVQYAWTRNRTTISNLVKVKEWSSGWNWGGQIERDLNECWSVNAGGAYNSSMTKEKRGTRAYGFKIGLARWF